MKTYHIPQTDLEVSRLAYGCMQIGGSWSDEPLTETVKTAALSVVRAAYEQGINFFDHADIYTRGKSEIVFADALKQMRRDQIVIQSKCGIRFPGQPKPTDPQRFDFSYQHIVNSVEGILGRLQTDYLDILLLHRPDALVEPEEVARAFVELHQSGKVRYFGVSNHNVGQMALLQKYVTQPLVVNQLEINLLHSYLINDGILANQTANVYAGATGILDYCRVHNIFLQAWSPVAGGRLFNPPTDAPQHVHKTAQLVAEMAATKETSKEAIVLAWLLRHPAGIQPIVGTTKPERVIASCLADEISLSREEWYALFIAGRGEALP
jgi:predicted oxidoreductase